ncbi:MAG: radical SAM protein, partial [Candidatus Thorarchaeota archaeon]
GRFDDMIFNTSGQLTSFGIREDEYENLLTKGEAFMTSGCSGKTMENACNRPFGNCTPYQAAIGHWRNYPITPNAEDVELIREQLFDYSFTYDEDETDFE